MEKIFDKLSSYNLFNNLLPGLIFLIFIKYLFDLTFINNENLLYILVTAYFAGLAFSRIGSIIVEPILKKVKFIELSDYKDFILATKNDTKIEILLEVANMFRAIVVVVAFVIGFTIYVNSVPYFWIILCAEIFILAIFLFSYKKQVRYIFNRVKANDYGKK
jgi:hypothetical protein